MADIAAEAPPQPGNRERNRDSLLLMGTIKAAGDYVRDTQPIRVRNLSSTGLMADSKADYDLGAHVEIGLRGVGLVQGEIVWVREGRMGVTFRDTIDPKRARLPVTSQSDDHLRKVIDLGRMRRPGLRID
jgi:hypothetical protein